MCGHHSKIVIDLHPESLLRKLVTPNQGSMT